MINIVQSGPSVAPERLERCERDRQEYGVVRRGPSTLQLRGLEIVRHDVQLRRLFVSKLWRDDDSAYIYRGSTTCSWNPRP